MSDAEYRIEDVAWNTGAGYVHPEHFFVYEDRALRWRERLTMWLFHRPDPRLLGVGPFADGEGPTMPSGQGFRISWNEDGSFGLPS